MKEKIIMFTTYIKFFHKLHTKYLKRFSNKIQLVYKDINNDIKFDEAIEVSKKTNSFSSDRDLSTESDSEINEVIRKFSISDLSDSNSSINKECHNDEFFEGVHESISNDEVNELFLHIETSCDSIINNIKSDTSEIEVKMNELDTNNDDINISEKTIEETIEETSTNEEVESVSTMNDTSIGEEPKKKRTYKPRKKKE